MYHQGEGGYTVVHINIQEPDRKDNGNSTPNKHNMIAIGVYFLLVLIVWLGLTALPSARVENLPEDGNYYSLLGQDMTNTLFAGANHWESWSEQFYTPNDFKSGRVKDDPVRLTSQDYTRIQYVTHRLKIRLTPDQTYGIHLKSSDYAMRMYIDGIEVGSVGVPGSTREEAVPRAIEDTYFFVPENNEVEIIIQTSNFVHGKSGCQPPDFVLGTPENIVSFIEKRTAFSFAVMGCLLTSALYHLGLFLLNRTRKTALYFAVCCALLALMTKSIVLMFLPEYNFYFWIRVEYLVHISVFLMLTRFLQSLFKGLLHKWVMRLYHGLIGIFALLTILTDTVIFTGLLLYFEIASALIIIYVLIRLLLALRTGGLVNWLAFLGMVMVGVPGFLDILYYRGVDGVGRFAGQYFMTPVGMVFFVFCYALVLSIEYAKTEQDMINAREEEQRLASENDSLDRINRLKTELMATISHEARTPLAVLSSYAGLVSMELKDKGVDPQAAADLDTIVLEAKRVANLIDSMKSLTLKKDKHTKQIKLNLTDIVTQTASLYQHLLKRAGISMEILIEAEIAPVFGDPEELTQVVFNLLQNAKNHTMQGSVTITVKCSGTEGITVVVADTGIGIAAELLPHVFERGISSDAYGSGLGLAICKEIIESHGGMIEVESILEKGTSVRFTLPTFKEEQHGTEGNDTSNRR